MSIPVPGHLKNMVLDMCLQSAPLQGSAIDLVDCGDDATQLWEMEDFGNSTTISLLVIMHYFVYFDMCA